MLDVHPPHHAATTWRDFFIHIATIVLGLLIAVGLEQTIEYLHHLHQLHEARQQIHEELLNNSVAMEHDFILLKEASSRLQQDTATLHLPIAPQLTNGPKLDYSWSLDDGNRVAWETANSDGAVALMPTSEAQQYSRLYRQGNLATQACVAYIEEMEIANAIAQRAPTVEGLTSQDREYLLNATSDTIGKLSLCNKQLAFANHMLKESFGESSAQHSL